MTKNQEAVAAQATVAHALWSGSFEGVMSRVAGRFPRRETRLTCRNMVEGLLMVKESANRWSLAEVIGHGGPHVLQHFLSRARFDDEAVRRAAADWHPDLQPISVLVSAVCRRWRVEEDFQGAKGLAHLDTGQVTCWTSWHRWSLMSMIAYALLAVGALHERQHAHPDGELAMMPVSLRELLALVRVFALPRPRQDTDPAHALHWSNWRRRHQHRATACHHRWNNVTAAAIA